MLKIENTKFIIGSVTIDIIYQRFMSVTQTVYVLRCETAFHIKSLYNIQKRRSMSRIRNSIRENVHKLDFHIKELTLYGLIRNPNVCKPDL